MLVAQCMLKGPSHSADVRGRHSCSPSSVARQCATKVSAGSKRPAPPPTTSSAEHASTSTRKLRSGARARVRGGNGGDGGDRMYDVQYWTGAVQRCRLHV